MFCDNRIYVQEEVSLIDTLHKLNYPLFLTKTNDTLRKGEGGMRKKGYYKYNYKLNSENGLWYICDTKDKPIRCLKNKETEIIQEYISSIKGDKNIEKLPLISVITVVLNGESYLEKTIQSIINQKYPNIEYIIIDGGSNDKSIDIIKKYDDCIDYWVSESDKGLYDAMNKGLSVSRGKYVIFINSGDMIYNENIFTDIVKVINEIKDIDFDFIYGDTIEMNDKGDLLYKKKRSHKTIWYGMFTHHQSMIYSMNIIREKSIFYDTNLKIAGDYKFTAEFLKNSKNILSLDFPISIFMQNGISAKLSKLGAMEYKTVRSKILDVPNILNNMILLFQIFMLNLRENFPDLYKKIRYRI